MKKVILVTGSSRGIGLATSLALAKKGHVVYATVRSLNSSQVLQNELKKFSTLFIRKLDVTKQKDCDLVVREIIKNEGCIDVLINNASSILFGPLETVTIHQLKKQFDVNLFGMIRTAQTVLPYMRKRKSGHLIFLGSTSGIHCSAMYGSYSATKFALEAIAYSFAVNLFRWNVRVSIIENNATKTDICEKSLIIGSRLKKTKNPYLSYIDNSLSFLKKIIHHGQLPGTVGKFISKVVENPSCILRNIATVSAIDLFNNHLKDPLGEKWIDEAKEELQWFESKGL